jgi:tripartite-type tricarboxylate transporter receptor subunit TctC
MDLVAKAADVTYKHVPYDGGAPAIIATISGETQVTTQLAAEQIDMILAKRLRPLATIGNQPLEVQGYGVIEPLSRTLANFTAPVNYFGIFVPDGVPEFVIRTLDAAWAQKISTSAALKEYARSRGALFSPLYGDRAQKAVFPAVQANAWQQFESGKAKISPAALGIPKPQNRKP